MKLSGNILILTQWSFKDALVQAYTLSYVDIIRGLVSGEQKIIVVTAEQKHLAMSDEEIMKVNSDWNKKNMFWWPLKYKRFGIKKLLSAVGQLFSLYRLIKREKIKTIHAFCTPAGTFAYMMSKLTGARLIIDSYEPHAEAQVENGTWKKNGLAYRILFAFEKRITRRASVIIATTEGMKQYALEKYEVEIKLFFVKPSCVNTEIFYPREKDTELLSLLGLKGKIVCIYAGKLGGIYLKEEVFDFIKACYNHWQDAFRFLLLTTATEIEIINEKKRVKLPSEIIISRFVPHKEIPRYLSLGDFALNPVKPVPTKRYCTPIKDGEYWAMGLPVVISPNISEDSAIIAEQNIGSVINFSNLNDIERGINDIEKLLKNQDELKKKIRSIAEKYRTYKIAEKIYKTIYAD